MSAPLSAGRVRSKTGCLTCKNRRKKCDETRPLCERCKKAGMTCLGYSYLEDSGDKAVRIRSKAAARVSAAKSAAATHGKNDSPHPGPPQVHPPVTPPTPSTAAVASPPMPARTSLLPLIPGMARDSSMLPTSTQTTYDTTPSGHSVFNSVFDFSFLSPLQPGAAFNPGLGDTTEWNVIFPPGEVGDANSAQHSEAYLDPAYGTQIDRQLAWGSSGLSEINQMPVAPSTRPNSSPDQPRSMTSGQASLFNALFSLGQPSAEPTLPTPAPSTSYTTSPASTWPSPDVEVDSDSNTSEDSDPEGIREIICSTPTLDTTVQSNSLPFVLQSYAQWISRTVYEPLRLAYKVRHWVTLRYTQSEDTRTSITMFAGLLNAMWKKDASTSEYRPLISMVSERVRTRVIQATSGLRLAATSQAEAASAMDEATQALDEAMEMVAVQMLSAPMHNAMSLFIEAAPLFRMACPEPPHEPLINLPGLFIHQDLNLRHFAAIDVVVAATLARPMLFRYDVHYDPAMCNGIMDTEEIGLQWLNGIPDQIVLLLARMNMLRDDFGPNVDPGVIQDAERELRDFTSQPGVSTDAYLIIARLAVQECWRLAAYIYLYMGLCGASSADPRVQKYTKSFIRLLERTKPGRTPDSFLIAPLLLAGVAAHRQRDRTLIQRRLLSVKECANRGTTGNDAVHMLEDIWTRTSAEGRPATWNDHKVAASSILFGLS